MPRRNVVNIPLPPTSETKRLDPTSEPNRRPPLDPDAEALLLVARIMSRARVAHGVAKIASGMLLGAGSRAVAVARAAGEAALHVAAKRVKGRGPRKAEDAAPPQTEDDDDRRSCVDVA